jgi:methionyl-tRNA formyltransferase
VKELAQRLGLPVSHDPADAATSGAELGVVVAFGRIIKPDVLDRLPMVNIHFSLLPRWRGAAPVERAILAGDTRTGVCLMAVEEGLDTGGVYRRAETSIGDDESAADLTARLARIGADLLVSALAEGLDRPVAQEGEVSYAAKVTPDDLRLDWQRSAIELHRIVRVGRAWTTWRGQRLLVLAARPVTEDPLGPSAVVPGAIRGDQVCTGSGWLQLLTVQPEGRSAVPAADWLRGARPTDSDHLGS